MMCISLILNVRSSLFHIHDFYAYVAAIAARNHFFHLYQQSNSTVFKAKFREARHCCKIIFEAVKLSLSHKKREWFAEGSKTAKQYYLLFYKQHIHIHQQAEI